MLYCSDVRGNKNKFYSIELLEDTRRDRYETRSLWGRVGNAPREKGWDHDSCEQALVFFKDKFKEKTGLDWENRQKRPEPDKRKRYVFMPLEPGESQGTEQFEGQEAGPAKQRLIKTACNSKNIETTMSKTKADAQKLPLDRLSLNIRGKGFRILVDIFISIITKGNKNKDELKKLNNLYYSTIPHNSGRHRPKLIDSIDRLLAEVDLLCPLTDMEKVAIEQNEVN